MKLITLDEQFDGHTMYMIEKYGKKRKYYSDDNDILIEIKTDKQAELKDKLKEDLTVTEYIDDNMAKEEISHVASYIDDSSILGCHEYLTQDDPMVFFVIVLWKWKRNKWVKTDTIDVDNNGMNTLLDTMTDMGWLKG